MMTIRDQLSNVTVSLLGHRCKHDARGAGRGVVGAGTRQCKQCIDGFVYSAGASGDVMGSLLVGNSIYGQHLFSGSNTTTCDSDIHTQLLHLEHPYTKCGTGSTR
jgi:hypothetical protein